MNEVNGKRSISGSESVIGTLIEPGKIGIVEHNGVIQGQFQKGNR